MTIFALSAGARADSSLAFPDAQQIVFGDGDRFALVVHNVGGRASMARHNLDNDSEAWTLPLVSPLVGVSMSAGSERVVAVEPVPGSVRNRMRVLRLSDGQPEAQIERPATQSAPELLRVESRERVALSDDGRWLALAGRTDLDVYQLSDEKRVVHEQAKGRWPQRVRFDASARRLAVGHRAVDQPDQREVVVYELAGEQWRQIDIVPGAAEPQWGAAGLLLLTKTAINLWRDGEISQLVELTEGMTSRQFADDAGRSAYYAPDGRAAVVVSARRFHVIDLESGRVDQERALTGRNAGVKAVAISNTRAAVFFSEELEGKLVLVALHTRRPPTEQAWGPIGAYENPLFNFSERKPWKPAYHPHLSSSTRYLAIEKPAKGGYRLHSLD